MKLSHIIEENQNQITRQEALKIANAKLKKMGIKPISDFNGGWGNHGAKPYEQDIKIPKELKPFIRTMVQGTKVSGDINYHSTYNSNPKIKISSWINGWTKKELIKGNGYSYSLGSIEWEYNLKTKKWVEL